MDKLEQKNLEKEQLRLELGSDYESSSDSSFFEELDFNNDPKEALGTENSPSERKTNIPHVHFDQSIELSVIF